MDNEKFFQQLTLLLNSLSEHVCKELNERVLTVSLILPGFCKVPWELQKLIPISFFLKKNNITESPLL